MYAIYSVERGLKIQKTNIFQIMSQGFPQDFLRNTFLRAEFRILVQVTYNIKGVKTAYNTSNIIIDT